MNFRKRGFRAMVLGLLVAGGLALAPAAFAGGSHVSVGVALPGVSVGYNGYGGGYVGVYAPSTYYAPAYYPTAYYPTAYYDYGPAYYSGYYAYPATYGAYYYSGGHRYYRSHHYPSRTRYYNNYNSTYYRH